MADVWQACETCLRRSWLVERMGSHLDFHLGRMIDVLALEDHALIELPRGDFKRQLWHEYRGYGHQQARAMVSGAQAAGVSVLCLCAEDYPAELRGVRAAPAVLYVAGGMERFLQLCAGDPVAIVGSRSATAYGLEVARTLGRGVSASGLTVVSGMAPGVDGAAHEGALAAAANTVAVIPGSAAHPYPRGQRAIHRRIMGGGAVVSEVAPGSAVRRWMMPARNRIIAGLSRLVILVQAAERSGAGLTVMAAQEYGRAVGAVPGSVLLEQSTGPNALLAQGASVIRDAQDVLDAVFGDGERRAAGGAAGSVLTELDESQRAVIEAIRAGADTAGALARVGYGGEVGLSVLARLELNGLVRRTTGGRYAVCG